MAGDAVGVGCAVLGSRHLSLGSRGSGLQVGALAILQAVESLRPVSWGPAWAHLHTGPWEERCWKQGPELGQRRPQKRGHEIRSQAKGLSGEW